MVHFDALIYLMKPMIQRVTINKKERVSGNSPLFLHDFDKALKILSGYVLVCFPAGALLQYMAQYFEIGYVYIRSYIN